MNDQGYKNYCRIEETFAYIQQHLKGQPTLEEIAKNVQLSLAQLQKLFISWAGVGPETFLHYVSVQHAKQMLGNSPPTLFETDYKTLLSETQKRFDSFVEIKEMTSEVTGIEGENLTINYSFAESLFGKILVASTHIGVCYLVFYNDKQMAFSELEKRFPKAVFIQQMDKIQENALQIFTQDWGNIQRIKLHLKGTDFQFKVWETLLKIPMGGLTTYGNIAANINQPKAARAVGTAIGSNPVAYIIPCHRVVQSSGVFGGYMWGTTRKAAIIGWEAAQVLNER